MQRHADDPEIGSDDAEDLCSQPYRTRQEALAVAQCLRAAGWLVVEHVADLPPRPDGLTMLASVYHPISFDSPGDLLVSGADLDTEPDPERGP